MARRPAIEVATIRLETSRIETTRTVVTQAVSRTFIRAVTKAGIRADIRRDHRIATPPPPRPVCPGTLCPGTLCAGPLCARTLRAGTLCAGTLCARTLRRGTLCPGIERPRDGHTGVSRTTAWTRRLGAAGYALSARTCHCGRNCRCY